jgi:hypothetical protein
MLFIEGPPNALYTEVMILDTSTGDLWTYLNQPDMGTAKGGQVIRYIARVRVPDSGGPVIFQRGFGN